MSAVRGGTSVGIAEGSDDDFRKSVLRGCRGSSLGIRDTCNAGRAFGTRKRVFSGRFYDFEPVGGTRMMDRRRGRLKFESDRPSLIKRTVGGFDTFLPGVVGLSRRSRPSSLLPRLNLVQLKIHQFMQTIGLLSAADERSVPKWNPSASRKA